MARWCERSPATSVAWVRSRSVGLSLLVVLAFLRGFFAGFSVPISDETKTKEGMIIFFFFK